MLQLRKQDKKAICPQLTKRQSSEGAYLANIVQKFASISSAHVQMHFSYTREHCDPQNTAKAEAAVPESCDTTFDVLPS